MISDAWCLDPDRTTRKETPMTKHTTSVVTGPSGYRATCTCGWGDYPRYTPQRAQQDQQGHDEKHQAKQ